MPVTDEDIQNIVGRVPEHLPMVSLAIVDNDPMARIWCINYVLAARSRTANLQSRENSR